MIEYFIWKHIIIIQSFEIKKHLHSTSMSHAELNFSLGWHKLNTALMFVERMVQEDVDNCSYCAFANVNCWEYRSIINHIIKKVWNLIYFNVSQVMRELSSIFNIVVIIACVVSLICSTITFAVINASISSWILLVMTSKRLVPISDLF